MILIDWGISSTEYTLSKQDVIEIEAMFIVFPK